VITELGRQLADRIHRAENGGDPLKSFTLGGDPLKSPTIRLPFSSSSSSNPYAGVDDTHPSGLKNPRLQGTSPTRAPTQQVSPPTSAPTRKHIKKTSGSASSGKRRMSDAVEENDAVREGARLGGDLMDESMTEFRGGGVNGGGGGNVGALDCEWQGRVSPLKISPRVDFTELRSGTEVAGYVIVIHPVIDVHVMYMY